MNSPNYAQVYGNLFGIWVPYWIYSFVTALFVLLILLVIAHLIRVFALSISAKKFQYVPWVIVLAVVGFVANLFLGRALEMFAVSMLESVARAEGDYFAYVDMMVRVVPPPVTIETVSAAVIVEFVLSAWSALICMIGGAIIIQEKPTFKGIAKEFAAIFKSCWWIILIAVIALTVVLACLNFTYSSIHVPFIGVYNLVFVMLILLLIRFRIYEKRS